LVVDRDVVEARVRKIRDAVGLLGELTAKGFGELSLHERPSMRYLVIQLVEAAAGLCVHSLAEEFGEKAENYPGCFSARCT